MSSQSLVKANRFDRQQVWQEVFSAKTSELRKQRVSVRVRECEPIRAMLPGGSCNLTDFQGDSEEERIISDVDAVLAVDSIANSASLAQYSSIMAHGRIGMFFEQAKFFVSANQFVTF